MFSISNPLSLRSSICLSKEITFFGYSDFTDMGIKKRLAWVRCSMGSVASSIRTKVALFHDITKFLTIVDNVAKAFYRSHHWLFFIIIVGQRIFYFI